MTHSGAIIYSGALSPSRRAALFDAYSEGEFSLVYTAAYMKTELWLSLTPQEQLIAKAVAATARRKRAAARGLAAVACHGLPIPGGLWSPQFLTFSDATKRARRYSVDLLLTRFGEARALSLLDSIVDIGSVHSIEAALIAAEHHVRTHPKDLVRVRSALAEAQDVRNAAGIRALASVLSATSESPRESELKYAMWQERLPAPLAQARVVTSGGRFVARPDFFFEEQAVVVEYDGIEKHTGAFGTTVDESLRRERERERQLINLGIRVVRFDRRTFSDGSAMSALRQALSSQYAPLVAPRYRIEGGQPAWRS